MTGARPMRGPEWVLLAGLTALNILSYVDRQLIASLAPLLIADLGLSRARIGLLVGASFVLVFALGSLVLGAVADRVHRPRLIAAGLAVWSLGTAGSAEAGGFPELLAMRLLVGLGEAALAPTALAMLADAFPASRLALASGIFYAGIPLGFGLSFALSGWIGPWLGWRACFLLLGLGGLLSIPMVLRLEDGARRRSGSPAQRDQARALARVLRERPAILLVSLAAGALAFSSAASQHTITWLVQERHIPFARAAFLSALVVGFAGLLGNVVIGSAADRWRGSHTGGRLLTLALLGVPGLASAAAFYQLTPTSALFVPAWFLGQMFLLGWFGAIAASLGDLAPPGMSGSVIGFGLLTLNVVGVGLGPWLTGLVGDRASLGLGLLLSLAVGAVGLGVLVIASTILAGEAAHSRSLSGKLGV